MLSSDIYNCRVCGLRLDDPPWGLDGRTPLYEFCPCCGVEFGYQDATRLGAQRHREKWLKSGGNWNESKAQPLDWNRAKQLEQVPEDFC